MTPEHTGLVHGRVLLVEDSRPDAALTREMLRPELPEVEVAHSPRVAAARRELRERPYDCLLLDLSLPDAEGLDGLRLIRASQPAIPVVVLTGSHDERVGVEALQAGAQDYLRKGDADGPALARAIRYAIERKRGEAELTRQALHDPLTGLPNRSLLLDRLVLALARTRPRSRTPAVLFCDLDGFKRINDTMGHEAGDAALAGVGARLAEVVRPSDTVSRYGGDEFVILLEEVAGPATAAAVGARVLAALEPPVEVEDERVPLGASIGVALARPGDDAETLLRRADAAMYAAKQDGGRRVAVEAGEPESFGDCGEEPAAIRRPLHDLVGRGGVQGWVVNWPGAGLFDAAWAEEVAADARRHGVAPADVVVLVAERAVVADPEAAAAQLGSAVAAGLRVGIRELGAGPIVLDALAGLPLWLVVLDAGLAGGSRAAAAGLARGLGARVAAPAPRDAAGAAALRTAGVELVVAAG